MTAFEASLQEQLDAAYSLAFHLLRNEWDAQDVTQQAMLRAIRHRDSFRGDNLRAWLLSIVRNCCHDFWAEQKSAPTWVEYDEAVHAELPGDETADAATIRASTREQLDHALMTLSPPLREALVMRELQELSYREIADALAVPLGTVMSRISRARDQLERALRLAGEEGR